MLNPHILLQAMSSARHTPSRQLQSTDGVPQPSSGPAGPDPSPNDATSQHPHSPHHQSNLSHGDTAGVKTEYDDPKPDAFQDGYSYSSLVGGRPTRATQYYQQNSQGGINPFSAPPGARPSNFTYRFVCFLLFRVFSFVSD